MPASVDLYNTSYTNYGSRVYRDIRIETYGQDLGQTSWVNGEESRDIPQMLLLKRASRVLEIGCGSGAYALHVAKTVECTILGLDLNATGVHNANQLARDTGLAARASFEPCDASKPLPFADRGFDAVFSNDSLCHIPGRLQLLREMFRVLKPNGRMLFSDALIVGGMISYEEIATRSSIGYYIYTPPGENERLIGLADFQNTHVTDTTQSAACISERWYKAREKREKELVALEGTKNFEGLQAFLSCVQSLTAERRLLRHLYLAEKRL
jgi:ubiquinone/menaquinone biosynthesis C-methylase UbiE